MEFCVSTQGFKELTPEAFGHYKDGQQVSCWIGSASDTSRQSCLTVFGNWGLFSRCQLRPVTQTYNIGARMERDNRAMHKSIWDFIERKSTIKFEEVQEYNIWDDIFKQAN